MTMIGMPGFPPEKPKPLTGFARLSALTTGMLFNQLALRHTWDRAEREYRLAVDATLFHEWRGLFRQATGA